MAEGAFSWRAWMAPTGASTLRTDVAEGLVTQALLMGVGLASSVVIARALGPAGQGLYAAAIALAMLGVQLGNFGLHSASTYALARDRSALGPLLVLVLLVAVGAGALAVAVTGAVSAFWPSLLPVSGPLLGLAVMYVPAGLAFLLLQSLLMGLQALRAYNALALGARVLSLGLCGCAIALGLATPEHFFAAGVVGLFAMSGVAGLWLWRRLEVAPRADWGLFRQNLRFGFRAYASALFAFLVLKLDLVMIQAWLGSTETGYYAIAVAMAEILYALPVVVGTLLFPRLSAMADAADRWRLTCRALAVLAPGMAVLAGLSALIVGPLVALFFGASFMPAVPAFLWLLPGIVLLSLHSTLASYFGAQGMPMVSVVAPAVGALLNVGLNVLWLPTHGILGAAWASSLSYGVMLAVSLCGRWLEGQRKGRAASCA